MKKETAEKILKETEKGYDMVADKFSETRNHFWPGLEFIKDYAKAEDKILDYGSGNSRILELFSDKPIEYTGADVSQNLVNIASKKFAGNVKFMKISSCNSLPFPDDYFNVVYAIAVFHHIPGMELRFKMAKELRRVAKPGGHIIVTVWNLWQKEHIKDIMANWVNKILQKSELDWNDCYIPFEKDNKNIFRRYHHVFRKNELKKIFSKAGFETEKCEIINGKNIFYAGIKI